MDVLSRPLWFPISVICDNNAHVRSIFPRNPDTQHLAKAISPRKKPVAYELYVSRLSCLRGVEQF
jgi:hypothetical protein